VLDIFLCHSIADRDAAGTIAARLERRAEAKVWLDECGSHSGATVAAAWEAGLSSAAILLLLSPSAVPQRLRREDWQSLLQHLESGREPPLGAVLLGDCQYPRLLERKRFFRWEDPARDALRAIERWIVSLHQQSEPLSFVPDPLPWFQGRQQELDTLWETLVDNAGVAVLTNAAPRSGKTSLAQEFARAAREHFRDILWVECGDRSPISIASELAVQLGASLDNSMDLNRLSALIQEHRLLVVFDDASDETPIVAPPDGRASVLITTRSSECGWRPDIRVLQIENAGCPVPEQPSAGSNFFKLCEAISVCRPQGFPVELAARIANLDVTEMGAACQHLVEQRWIDPLDAPRGRFRLGAGSLAQENFGEHGERLRQRHAAALSEALAEWRKRPDKCKSLLAELDCGLEWAMRLDWSLATTLADRAFAFLGEQDRLPEAADIYTRLRQAALERRDSRVVENCTWELSWIQDERGEIRQAPLGGQLALEFT